MEDIKVKDIENAQKRAAKKAIGLNKKAGLKTYIIKENNVIEVDPEGNEKIIKQAEFKNITSLKRKFTLKDGSKKD